MIRAIIVGGDYSADYIIKTFTKNKIPFIVVNGDRDIAEFLSKSNKIDVYCSDPTKFHTYDDLNIYNYDLVVALENDDIKNYIIVSILKKIYQVKRAICTVSDADNVEIFKSLGVDKPVSVSHLLSQQILNESNIEAIMKTFLVENDKIFITEIAISKDYKIVGKEVKDIQFPEPANISCIYRDSNVIVARGFTRVLAGDRILICCDAHHQKKVVDFIKQS